jgi:hypothetical protein
MPEVEKTYSDDEYGAVMAAWQSKIKDLDKAHDDKFRISQEIGRIKYTNSGLLSEDLRKERAAVRKARIAAGTATAATAGTAYGAHSYLNRDRNLNTTDQVKQAGYFSSADFILDFLQWLKNPGVSPLGALDYLLDTTPAGKHVTGAMKMGWDKHKHRPNIQKAVKKIKDSTEYHIAKQSYGMGADAGEQANLALKKKIIQVFTALALDINTPSSKSLKDLGF